MFYAYILNGGKGIVDSWAKCEAIVKGQSSAKYKKFKTIEEATEFISNNGITENITPVLDKNAIYFDAGTGRGRGVEVRVTRSNGTSLLDYLVEKRKDVIDFFNKKGWKINEFGNIELGKEYTNNFGELLGCYIALIISNIIKTDKIFGDSDLVIKYWSENNCKMGNKLTVKLSKTVSEMKKHYGVKISHISGDINPADLGFHK